MLPPPLHSNCIFPDELNFKDLPRLHNLAVSGNCSHVKIIRHSQDATNKKIAFYILVDTKCQNVISGIICNKNYDEVIRMIARNNYAMNKAFQIAYILTSQTGEIIFAPNWDGENKSSKFDMLKVNKFTYVFPAYAKRPSTNDYYIKYETTKSLQKSAPVFIEVFYKPKDSKLEFSLVKGQVAVALPSGPQNPPTLPSGPQNPSTLQGPVEKAARLFYIYSHKDESLRDELENHLKILQRQGLIEPWYDREIGAGDEWKHRIDENLERADIILLLVSADFIASDYCYETEMKRALARQDNNEAYVIPIILRDVNWNGAPFSNFQALPKDSKAITLWPNRDNAWRHVSEGIQKIVEKIRKKSGLS